MLRLYMIYRYLDEPEMVSGYVIRSFTGTPHPIRFG